MGPYYTPTYTVFTLVILFSLSEHRTHSSNGGFCLRAGGHSSASICTFELVHVFLLLVLYKSHVGILIHLPRLNLYCVRL